MWFVMVGHGRTDFRTPRRISHAAGEIPDEKNHLMTELLKLAELADGHGVSDVQIGRGRIETFLDDQRLARFLGTLEFAFEVFDQNGLLDAAQEKIELFFDGWEFQSVTFRT